MSTKARYESLMKRIEGTEWEEPVYFILCKAVNAHSTNDLMFMRTNHALFDKCPDVWLKRTVEKLASDLHEEYKQLAWFVNSDHQYFT